MANTVKASRKVISETPVNETSDKDNYPDILNSRNKHILLELPGYTFDRSFFIGRQSLVNKLTTLISSENKTGVYLVTGNRGVGKTRLVEEVIKEVKKESATKNHIFLKINFGHDVLNERDVLRLITRSLTTKYKRFCKSSKTYILYMLVRLILAFAVLLPATCFFCKNIEKILPFLCETISRYHITDTWLFFFFTFCLLGLFLWLRFFIPPLHYSIRKQLKQLNENITYSVEREINVNGGNEKGNIMGNIGKRKKKTRLIADAREIEKELQDILENIQKIRPPMARPEFVIVFDELDKVSPETQNQESEAKHKEALFASNSTRERQAIILKLLSNMKYFLSTAKAKFIFIAGSEMYDMYLADIADRNNYFGSIFNEVIFVPSFLTDVQNNKKLYDITTLVEEYVCRHLIPKNDTDLYTLKAYKQYLDNEIYKDDKGNDAQLVEMKKQKIIATLQQFIIYLAHTSKGAPKKMVQVFESFIEIYSKELNDKYLIVRRKEELNDKQDKNTKLYLGFDNYDQFTIGMTSYLITPVFNHLSDANIQAHSDKLLVSTLHFVDYMMKFHSQNFSWRSIDISPEVIEINRSPELKTIVNDIVTLFEQIHFHKPIITLYEFKFDALLAQEIFFLSKMDERFSAQFNFSLDESLILKEYYKRLLKERQAEYEQHTTYGSDYISSIASLHIVIGDLHFLDDELEEAALHYKDGLYLLKKQLEEDKEKEDLEIFYLYIRNQLKLAYLYEKRNQADFAYLLYGKLTTLVAKYRDFDLEKFGISIRKNDEDFIMVKSEPSESAYNKNVEIEPYSRYFDVPIYNAIGKAKICPMKFEQLSPATQRIMFKNMTFEGLQLLYLPLLAKLQILEKRSLVGILEKDIQAIEQEFDFLTRTIRHSETKILAADFYSKIGDILFYKNQVFNSLKFVDEKQQSADNKRRINISHHACLFYKKAFIALTVRMSKDSEKKGFEKETVLDILYLKADYIDSKVSTRYRAMMARVLSNLGDAYLQANKKQCNFCPFNKVKPIKMSRNGYSNKKFWENWRNYIYMDDEKLKLSDFIKDIKSVRIGDCKAPLHNVELALFLYSLSMKYYRKANDNKQYAYQIEKILNVLKYCLRHDIHRNRVKQFLTYKNTDNRTTYLETLTRRAIRALYLAYDSLNMFEINKRKEDFDRFSKSYGEQKVPLHYIQVDSSVSRIRTIVKELELELAKDDPKKVDTIKKLYAQYITSPYQINYSIWARVLRLRMKDRLNREAYEIMKQDIVKFCTEHNCCRFNSILP